MQSDTASVFNKHMDWMEQQFVPAAEAMPEDKFFWAPTNGEFKGVRNFAEQLIHVAEVNFALSAAILGENPPKDTSAEAMKTRSAVLQYLKDSFDNTHRAFSSISEQNAKQPIQHPLFDMTTTRMGLAIVSVAHPFDHYGQMVEYVRMNNIIPPQVAIELILASTLYIRSGHAITRDCPRPPQGSGTAPVSTN